MKNVVDLRSDTVTRPTAAMRDAMMAAPLGDDVFGDDPSVNGLQDKIAAMLGFEAALFMPTGTQSNLCALLSHCQRGDEYIVGQFQHCYRWEGGGAAVFGSVQPQPLEHQPDGTLALEAIEAAIKPDDPHFARTRLLCLENTWHGRALPGNYLRDARALCDRRGLALHLDGARLYNAAVAQGVPVREIAAHFDSVSVCLSKGLGAPVGSVLLGSRGLIDQARRWRKVAGGGMRQAGMLAAAGLHALDHHVARLADDHRRATALAEGLRGLPGIEVVAQHTNMVFLDVADGRTAELKERLEARDIRIAAGYGSRVRLVTHLDIDDAGLARTIGAIADFTAR